MPSQETTMLDVISLCKRRGFIFQNSEIYGGLQGVYDYGPLGVELKNNLKNAWWKSVVHGRTDIEGLDSAILSHRLSLKHSGHEDTFSDPMLDCRECKFRMRADHVIDAKCSNCGSKNLTSPREFNLMFKCNFGPINDGSEFVYLRPETAQGIFTNFKNICDISNKKLPFGIAQIGKAFRNEITARNFIFRTREFEQMEIEYFVEPGTDDYWHEYWVQNRLKWWIKQGISNDKLCLSYQDKEKLAHYSKATTDILYKYPHGFDELEGIANRTDFDLASHSRLHTDTVIQSRVERNCDSNTQLAIYDQMEKKYTVPFIIEPSAGLDRGVLAILVDAFHKEKMENGDCRIVLKLKPHLAPVKVAIVPLAKNNELIRNTAIEIFDRLINAGIGCIKFEDSGNVGKAYRKNDEIGTPFCVTVDFETIENTADKENMTVTIRDRDSMAQHRILVRELEKYILAQVHYYL